MNGWMQSNSSVHLLLWHHEAHWEKQIPRFCGSSHHWGHREDFKSTFSLSLLEEYKSSSPALMFTIARGDKSDLEILRKWGKIKWLYAKFWHLPAIRVRAKVTTVIITQPENSPMVQRFRKTLTVPLITIEMLRGLTAT